MDTSWVPLLERIDHGPRGTRGTRSADQTGPSGDSRVRGGTVVASGIGMRVVGHNGHVTQIFPKSAARYATTISCQALLLSGGAGASAVRC